MATPVPAALMNQLKATNGKSITCKAAVAWEPKKPLDVTDIQVHTVMGTSGLSKISFFDIFAFLFKMQKNL
jgi:hypothetical protein